MEVTQYKNESKYVTKKQTIVAKNPQNKHIGRSFVDLYAFSPKLLTIGILERAPSTGAVIETNENVMVMVSLGVLSTSMK